jgi:hypothetical protein
LWPRLAAGLLLAIAAAYGLARLGYVDWPRKYDPFALPDLAATPSLLTSWQMKLVDADAQNCAIALSRAGLAANLKPDVAGAGSCGKSGAIELGRLSVARLKPEDTRCAIAARLYMWERHSLQPAARRLLGEEIGEIMHFGSYNCRNMRGGTSMSEHATANAFDISGFRTASGRQISVLRDWNKPTAQGRFLRAAHEGLCDWFNTTLGPDFNADHADHFHADMGTWRTCR